MALLAHLQGHALIYAPGKASCYIPKPSSPPPIRAGTQTRPPHTVPIDGQVLQSSQQLQSNPEHAGMRSHQRVSAPEEIQRDLPQTTLQHGGASGAGSSFRSSSGDGLPRQAAFPLPLSGPRRPSRLARGQHAAMNEQHILSESGRETRSSCSPGWARCPRLHATRMQDGLQLHPAASELGTGILHWAGFKWGALLHPAQLLLGWVGSEGRRDWECRGEEKEPSTEELASHYRPVLPWPPFLPFKFHIKWLI